MPYTMQYRGESGEVDGKTFRPLVNKWLAWQQGKDDRNLWSLDWWANTEGASGNVAGVDARITTDDPSAAIDDFDQFVQQLNQSQGTDFPPADENTVDIL